MDLKPKRNKMGTSTRNMFLDRLHQLAGKHPIAVTVEKAVGDIFLHHAGIDHVAAKIQEQADYGFLNEAGKVDARRKALTNALKDRVKVQRQLETLATTLGDVVPKVKPRSKDDTIGELQDAELRSIVRAMPEKQRNSLRHSPEVMAAIARAPAIASGVQPGVHDQIRKEIVEAENPGRLAGWDSAREALEVAGEVLKEVDKDFADAAGFNHRHEYEQHIAESIVPAVDKEKPRAMVVDPVRGLPPEMIVDY